MKKTLPLPLSINAYYSQNRQGRRFKTQEARDWEEEAGYLLLNHKKFGNKKVSLVVEFYFKNNASDISNRLKILEDVFEKQGIIDNDNQILEEHIYKFVDTNNQRVEIEMSEYEGVI